MRTRHVLEELRELRAEMRAELHEARHQQAKRDGRLDALIGEVRDESRINREVIRRNEIAFVQSSQRLGEAVAELRAGTREIVAELKDFRGESRDEARAQREALFSLIDEMRGGGPEPATGT